MTAMTMTLTSISAIASRSVARRFVARRACICRSVLPPPSSAMMMSVVASSGGGSSFSMDLLKDLRARSGAPIVECKKALQHADNDLTAAMGWLREHGAAKASSKLQGRETSEGLIGLSVSDDGKSASLVRLASETDFAGRNSICVDLVLNAAEATVHFFDEQQQQETSTIEAETILETKTSATSPEDQSVSVKDQLDEAIVAIRENLSFPNLIRMQAIDKENGILVGYVHNRVDSTKEAGTAAAVVEVAPLNDAVSVDTLQSVGKKLAMHVVAARPQYLSPDDVPETELENEKDILTKQQEGSGKPPDIVEKIVLGRLRKFYEASCLTHQPHMIEDKNPIIGKSLKDQGIVIKQFQSLSIS